MNNNDLSKFISLILRHKPETIGITLNDNGWANVDDLINGINKSTNKKVNCVTLAILEDIVNSDNKNRYSFNNDKTFIRANQGHSIKVNVDLKEVTPPKILYHGTAEKYINSIRANGLKAMNRLYVHLSDNKQTAITVGSRHGIPIILEIDSTKMFEDGYKFYISENNVWLTNNVPQNYIIREIK